VRAQITFTRTLGACVVPHRGQVPLGLGSETGRTVISVDDHIRLKQAELIDRMNSKGMSLSTSPLSVSSERLTIADFNLETRQYDYKPGGIVNPLFHSISEEGRRLILCQEITASGVTSRTRSRSDSVGSANGKSATTSTTVSESEVNKELETIRQSRDQSGCNCKPMKVDKLSFGKIKSLLSARCSDIGLAADQINTLTKPEANDWMRKLIKICPICVAGGCSCISLEMECSAELCGCLRRIGSSGSRCNRSDSVDSTEADGSQIPDNRCGNGFGQAIFDPDVVDQYRKSVLTSLKTQQTMTAAVGGFQKLKINNYLDVPAHCN
jgi:hypothetical protein